MINFYFKVVKNYNFVTMDQLEEDEETVEYCRTSLAFRKQLVGDEHEVNTNFLTAYSKTLTTYFTACADLRGVSKNDCDKKALVQKGSKFCSGCPLTWKTWKNQRIRNRHLEDRELAKKDREFAFNF